VSQQPWWKNHGIRWRFRGLAPDVIGLLVVQGKISSSATEAFLEWSECGSVAFATLTQFEKDADKARRALLTALRRALATPIDQEDLYILSERCDRVVNAVRDIAAEAEALGWTPDARTAVMARHLHAGMRALVDGFAKLRRKPDLAGAAADSARSEAQAVARLYRESMATLFGSEDVRTVIVGGEFYRQYARVAELLVAVADRLWYVVLAEV
jgi:uncharacterized protein Yka (UPF0111/DUF47 family)